MQQTETKTAWRNFSLNIGFVVLFFILAAFLALFLRNRQLMEAELLSRARSHFASMVLARQWNAQLGGVYAEITETMPANPYLPTHEFTSTDGRVFALKNPAIMTKEISELSARDGDLRFRLTSLNPLNPANTPDDFEREALQSFEKGQVEFYRKETSDSRVHYRYMAPLHVEASCLPCHAAQGYKVGDVRGGISVRFDVTAVENALRASHLAIILLFLASSVLLLGILYVFIMKLQKRLAGALRTIEQMAITDELSGLYNRRYFFRKLEEEIERSRRYKHPTSCLLFDIDHFKRVNDTHGHPVGDAVIRDIGRILRESSRKSDIAARYGGEEFALLLPETRVQSGLLVAEKLRSAIENHLVDAGAGLRIRVTASIGVSGWETPEGADTEKEALVKACDTALYRAKQNGRNRVEHITEMPSSG